MMGRSLLNAAVLALAVAACGGKAKVEVDGQTAGSGGASGFAGSSLGGAAGSDGQAGAGLGGRAGSSGAGGSTGGSTGGCGGVSPCCCDPATGCPGGQQCVMGACLPILLNSCWQDSDCSGSFRCVGVELCGCGANCDGPSRPGQCIKPPSNCCQTASDCGDAGDELCVQGVCKLPVSGRCWTEAECALGQVCNGVRVCDCGVVCGGLDTPGVCQPAE